MITTRAISLLLGLVLAIGVANKSRSQPYVYNGNPNCPVVFQGYPRHTWKDYLMGKYRTPPGTPGYWISFGVRFDHLAHNIGTIPAGAYYTITHNDPAWIATGINVFGEKKRRPTTMPTRRNIN